MYNELRKTRKQDHVKVIVLADLIHKTTNVYYRKETGIIPFALEEGKILAEYLKKPMEVLFLR